MTSTSRIGVPHPEPESQIGAEQVVPSNPREQVANSSECEDGTNVEKGTPFLVVASVTEHWYRPDESTCPTDWKPRWKRLRSRFEQVIDKRRPIACVLVEKRIPEFPKFADYSDTCPYGRELIQGGGGLHLEPSLLYNPDRSPLFGAFPIHNVNGRPMSNSPGQPFGFRFGLYRQFFLSVEQADLRGSLTMPGPRMFELASDGAALFYQLPSDLAISLWRNWRQGFSPKRGGRRGICGLTRFSSCRGSAALEMRSTVVRRAWLGDGTVALVGQGLFPRLPDMSQFPGSIRVPEDNGYPVAWRSTLEDIRKSLSDSDWGATGTCRVSRDDGRPFGCGDDGTAWSRPHGCFTNSVLSSDCRGIDQNSGKG